ncbi:unnamed protein product [Rhizophagus irregularis]|nr:unnamed protein product [Rhizophagus irregularis]
MSIALNLDSFFTGTTETVTNNFNFDTGSVTEFDTGAVTEEDTTDLMIKKSFKLSLPKKNKEPVKSTASKKAKTTIKNVEDEDNDPFISLSSSSRGGTSSINTPKYDRQAFQYVIVYDNSKASSSSIYTDIKQEQQTDSIPLSDADMKSYCEAYSNMNPHHMWTLKSGHKVLAEPFVSKFDQNIHFDLDFTYRSMLFLWEAEENPFVESQLEGWYKINIWGHLIDPLFHNLEVELKCGEGMSFVSSDQKNDERSVDE